MRKQLPSGVVIDILRNQNGDTHVDVICQPKQHGSFEEGLRDEYSIIKEALVALKNEGVFSGASNTPHISSSHVPGGKGAGKPVQKKQADKSGKVGKNISHKYPLKNNGYTWNLSAVKEPAIPTPVTTYGVIPIDKNNAASKGKTTIEIYRMAMDMVFFPDKQTLKDGQYVDDTLRAAYEQVQYYFSHPWNAAANGIAANSKGIDPVTSYMYERMIAAIYGNDTNEQKEGIKILEERSKWYNAFSWADLASNSIIPAADLKFLQSAVENVKSLPEGFQLFANAARFRTEAANLNEQIALKEAMSGEGKPIMEGELEDQRLKGKGFTKYQYQKEFKDPMTGKVKRIIIHYLKDGKTGAIFDFKFKDN